MWWSACAEEARVHLGHAGEEPLLVVVQRVPRTRDVELGERLAVGAGARLGSPIGLTGGSSVSAGTMPSFFWLRERLLADRLVAHVELALELVDPLLRRVVRRVAGARRVVEEERLLRRDRLRVADELERLVGDVLGEVVALLGRLRLVDRDGCRRRGRDTTGSSRRRGTRTSARSRARSASCAASRRGSSRRSGTDATCRPCRCSSRARRGSPTASRSPAGSCRSRSGSRSPPR